MAKKPLYQKIQESKAYERREDAVEYVKIMKEQYRQAGESVKYDVVRTVNSQWKVVIFMKDGNF